MIRVTLESPRMIITLEFPNIKVDVFVFREKGHLKIDYE